MTQKQCVKLKPDLVVAELLAREARPPDGILAFLDVLLRFASLIVEGDHPLGWECPNARICDRCWL